MRFALVIFLLACSSRADAAPSCAGPADPKLTPARVSGMLQGDDDYPLVEMKKLGPGVMPALVDLAGPGHRNGYVRARAISLLGDLGCRDTAKVVEDALRDPEPTIRLPAASAIGKVHADPTPVLAGMLGDKDAGVVKFTIKSLAVVGDKRAIAPLDKVRTSHGEAWLRDLATSALVDIRKRHP